MRDIKPASARRKHPLQPLPEPAPRPVAELLERDAPYKPAGKLKGASVPVGKIEVPLTAPLPPGRQLRPVKDRQTLRRPHLSQRDRVIISALFGLAVMVGFLSAIIFLPSADIKLILRTAPLLVEQKLTLSAEGAPTEENIPGKAFSREADVDGSSTVTSTEVVGTKAKGTLYIVNRTLQEQKIKEKSRLVTKDGTLFYLNKGVSVPAAEGSAIARAAAEVEAAEAGQAGNIAPQRLDFAALPEGSQTLVYAEADKAMSGGTGETVAVVKTEDIQAAKTLAGKIARDKVEQDIRAQLPLGWTILDESWAGELQSFETQIKEGDKEAAIPFKAKVTVRVMGFQAPAVEEKLRQALNSRLSDQYMLFPGPISYTKTIEKTDWAAGTAQITARVTHTTIPKFGIDALRDKLAGRSSSEARQYLEGLPGVQSADLKFWPFWVSSVPRIASRINLNLEPERQP